MPDAEADPAPAEATNGGAADDGAEKRPADAPPDGDEPPAKAARAEVKVKVEGSPGKEGSPAKTVTISAAEAAAISAKEDAAAPMGVAGEPGAAAQGRGRGVPVMKHNTPYAQLGAGLGLGRGRGVGAFGVRVATGAVQLGRGRGRGRSFEWNGQPWDGWRRWPQLCDTRKEALARGIDKRKERRAAELARALEEAQEKIDAAEEEMTAEEKAEHRKQIKSDDWEKRLRAEYKEKWKQRDERAKAGEEPETTTFTIMKGEGGKVGLRYTGQLVEWVKEGGAAHEAGLREGMLIISVQGGSVETTDEVKDAFAEAPECFEVVCAADSEAMEEDPPTKEDVQLAKEWGELDMLLTAAEERSRMLDHTTAQTAELQAALAAKGKEIEEYQRLANLANEQMEACRTAKATAEQAQAGLQKKMTDNTALLEAYKKQMMEAKDEAKAERKTAQQLTTKVAELSTKVTKAEAETAQANANLNQLKGGKGGKDGSFGGFGGGGPAGPSSIINVRCHPGQPLGISFGNSQDLRVMGVAPGSPAEFNGIGNHVGWMLTEINGRPVRFPADAATAQQQATLPDGSKQMRMVFVQDGGAKGGGGGAYGGKGGYDGKGKGGFDAGKGGMMQQQMPQQMQQQMAPAGGGYPPAGGGYPGVPQAALAPQQQMQQQMPQQMQQQMPQQMQQQMPQQMGMPAHPPGMPAGGAPAAGNLPPGWLSQYDAARGATYYCNPMTGQTQWTPPQF